jgi:hypothetical protein
MGGPINYSADEGDLVPQLGQLATLFQQRIRHIYRRQRTSPLPSRTAKSRHQSQLGVDGFDVAHAVTVGAPGCGMRETLRFPANRKPRG